MMDAATLAARYQGFQTRFEACSDCSDFDCVLVNLQTAEDTQLPQHALGYTLRQLATTQVWEAVRGQTQGTKRFTNLLWFMERVFIQAREMIGSPVPQLSFDPRIASQSDWNEWRELICNSNLSNYQLGRFVRSLRDWSDNLSCLPLHSYFEYSLRVLLEQPCAIHILGVYGDVARAVSGQAGGHLSSVLLTSKLHAVGRWVECVLASEGSPNSQELTGRLLNPLLEQLQSDLDPLDAELIRRRWVDRVTLQVLGDEQGVERETIRLRTNRAADVFKKRWPEGQYLLNDLFERVRGASGATAELDTMRTILDSCYSAPVRRGGSRAEVLGAWIQAGGGLETPVTEAELFRWSGARFPNLPANTVRGWLDAEGLVAETHDQGTLFFGARLCVGDEGFLRSSMESGLPVSLQAICEALQQSEHTVRNRLSRYSRLLPFDQRAVLEDEDATTVESDADDEAEEEEATQYIYSERYGFVRRNGMWCVRLSQGHGSRLNVTELPLTDLAHLIVGGLTEQGIWDASVWGVHEYVKRRLQEVYRATLRSETNPFALARMLVRVTRVGTDGLIRTMRRRRLRWDPQAAPCARGKLGWIGEVLARCGRPLTAEELSNEMSRVYQTYFDYVYVQLPTTNATGSPLNFTRLPGHSTRRPVIFVHNDWAPNVNGSNASEGVREFINQVVSAPEHLRYAQAELLDARLIQLCERSAGRSLEWATEPPVLPEGDPSDEGPA